MNSFLLHTVYTQHKNITMQQAHFIAGTLTSLDDYTFNKYMITSAKEDMFLPWLSVSNFA